MRHKIHLKNLPTKRLKLSSPCLCTYATDLSLCHRHTGQFHLTGSRSVRCWADKAPAGCIAGASLPPLGRVVSGWSHLQKNGIKQPSPHLFCSCSYAATSINILDVSCDSPDCFRGTVAFFFFLRQAENSLLSFTLAYCYFRAQTDKKAHKVDIEVKALVSKHVSPPATRICPDAHLD